MASARLHPAWAVVKGKSPAEPPAEIKRGTRQQRAPDVAVVFDKCRSKLHATPTIYRLPDGRYLLWSIVASLPEMERIVAKRLPGCQVDHIEIEPSFSEFHEAAIDVSWWLRELAPG